MSRGGGGTSVVYSSTLQKHSLASVKDASPTSLQRACSIGSRTEPGLQILDLPLPNSLDVVGAAARKLGLQGLFCLQGADVTQNIDGRGVSTPVYQLSMSHRCEDGPAEGMTTILRLEANSWTFKARSCEASAKICDQEPVTLAACVSQALRPDRLAADCFGFPADEFNIAPACVRRAALSVEVGGPGKGPGSQERGEYRRTLDVANHPAYEKPDESRHLPCSCKTCFV